MSLSNSPLDTYSIEHKMLLFTRQLNGLIIFPSEVITRIKPLFCFVL